MYEFFDRLVATALPRIRDFRGVSRRAFDGRGNYSLGLPDQTIFPEIELDKIKRQQGMDITIVTTRKTNEEALELLKMMGMPFAEKIIFRIDLWPRNHGWSAISARSRDGEEIRRAARRIEGEEGLRRACTSCRAMPARRALVNRCSMSGRRHAYIAQICAVRA